MAYRPASIAIYGSLFISGVIDEPDATIREIATIVEVLLRRENDRLEASRETISIRNSCTYRTIFSSRAQLYGISSEPWRGISRSFGVSFERN